jgi:hypothetical protein
MDTETNYDSLPPSEQLSFNSPPLIAQALADSDMPFRVDGYRSLHDNYGSLYQLADIRGISPLFLNSTHALIQDGGLINPTAWELFAVRYVYTDWETLPVPSEIIGTGEDRYGEVKLHHLSDPRPFALMLYDSVQAENDEAARNLLADTNFNPRRTVILAHTANTEFPNKAPQDTTVAIIDYKPESFTIQVNTPANGILSVANPDYPGWSAAIDGAPAEIIRAYGALQALAIPSGEHTLQFVFEPLSYRIGALVSILTWASLGILGCALLVRRRRNAAK